MKACKEEYILEFKDYKVICIDIYALLLKLNLINNLRYKEYDNKKLFYSYNNILILKVILLKNTKHLCIKTKTKNLYINKIRKIIINKLKNVKILYSDFLINKNIYFYRRFIKYENILRKKIINILTEKYGSNWWANNVDNKVSNICVKRSKFDDDRFHYIFYADFIDLKNIILKNWKDLECLFDSDVKNLEVLNKINSKRNKIFHGRFDFI